MVGFCVVQLQRSRKAVEDLDRHAAQIAALHPGVVLHTDAGEHRDLFAAQARHASATAADDARLLRRDPVPPRAQEVADLVLLVHALNATGLCREVGGTASARISTPSQKERRCGALGT